MPNPKHYQYPIAPLPLEVYRAQDVIFEAIYNLSNKETLELADRLKKATSNILTELM